MLIDPFISAGSMLRALRERRVSAIELLDLHLARMDRYNGELNAVVARDDTVARRAAEEADAARARGEEAPLLGLPFSVKDSIDVRGFRTVCGMGARREIDPAGNDAPMVAQLRRAGGVVMGKTNTPPYAGDWETANRVFGRTANPWKRSHTPGGSSGGAAAAVAAGLSPLDFGSDIGGSIRIPAVYCGIYGHRPSEALVARSGHYPGSPLPNPGTVLNVLGPLAREAADLELALETIAGPDEGEGAWRVELPPARHQRLAGFRVATLPRPDWIPVSREISDGLEALAWELRRAGARVEEAQPDGFGDLRHLTSVYAALMRIAFLRETDAESRARQAREDRESGDPILAAMAEGNEAGSIQYLRWLDEREVYRAAYRDFFRHWDVLLAPVSLSPAPPYDGRPVGERTVEVDVRSIPAMWQVVYPGVATLAGQPATGFPLGLSAGGLPFGAQVIGPYLEDRTPIRFAALLAEAFGTPGPPPGFP